MAEEKRVETFFSGVREKWLPLYRQLHQAAAARVGNFSEHVTSSAVNWKHNSSFAGISAKKDCMVIGFASDKLHGEWKAVKTVQTSKNRVAHYFEIAADDNFAFFIDRIEEAYKLTDSGRTPRKYFEDEFDYKTIDEYIGLYPEDVQKILVKIRETIKNAAPEAIEKISWKMPTFWQKENLIHFAVAKSHVGIYPGASGVEAYAHRLKGYKTSKGAIQLPLSEEIPYELIAEITRFRVNEVEQGNN